MDGARKSTVPPWHELLGQAQGREGLAGAAGHDEGGAVGRLELGLDGVDGPALMLAGLKDQAFAALPHLLAGEVHAVGVEVLPREVGPLDVVEADAHDVVVLVDVGLEVLGELYGGVRKDPVGVDVLRGLHEEGGHGALGQGGVRVALGLDGPVLAGLGVTGHEVDAHVLLAVVGGGVGPHPDAVEPVGIERVVLKEELDGPLPGGALVLFVDGLRDDTVEDLADR